MCGRGSGARGLAAPLDEPLLALQRTEVMAGEHAGHRVDGVLVGHPAVRLLQGGVVLLQRLEGDLVQGALPRADHARCACPGVVLAPDLRVAQVRVGLRADDHEALGRPRVHHVDLARVPHQLAELQAEAHQRGVPDRVAHHHLLGVHHHDDPRPGGARDLDGLFDLAGGDRGEAVAPVLGRGHSRTPVLHLLERLRGQ